MKHADRAVILFVHCNTSFFLYIGVTSARFSMSGKLEVVMEELIRTVSGVHMTSDPSRSNFNGILSNPLAFLAFNLFNKHNI